MKLSERNAMHGRYTGREEVTLGKPWKPNAVRQRRRGAAAVEFALIAPLIFVLLFASVEFGRLLMAIHGIDAAAREGCRAAISWEPTRKHVAETVAANLGSFGISGYTLTTKPTEPGNADRWEPVTVRIAVPYSQVSWLPLPRFLQDIQLAGSCTLPQESERDQ